MNKIIKFMPAAIALAGILAFAAPASAATVTSSAVFPNGQTQVYGNAGSSVQTNFQVHVNAGEVFHAIRTKVDSQPTVCTAVGPFEGDQTVNVNVNITLPPNSSAGGYSLTGDLFTTDTLPQAQAMTGDLACSSAGSGAHVFNNAYNGSTVVNVLPSNGSTSGSSNTDLSNCVSAGGSWNALTHICAANGGTSTPPPVSTMCTQLSATMVGTQMNVYNSANIALQGFLLYQHESIPWLAQGASFGYFGPQTQAALTHFKLANNCQ